MFSFYYGLVAFVENVALVDDAACEMIRGTQGGFGFFIAGQGLGEERASVKDFWICAMLWIAVRVFDRGGDEVSTEWEHRRT